MGRHFIFSFLGICGIIGPLLCACVETGARKPCLADAQAEPKCQLEKSKMDYERKYWGVVDGRPVSLYRLTNANGLEADISDYGAIVTRLTAPDRDGKLDDIVLGYDTVDEYVANSPYFGAIVGRYGNRIANGRFTLDGVEYKLAVNNGPNHLHGGLKGFDKVIWDAQPSKDAEGVRLKLTYTSKDGEEGYPGTLKCTVIYTLTNNNEMKIDYEAATDKATPINLTHHGYWNLAGQGSRDILDHEMMINADMTTPVDSTLITTGELKPVKGTPLDFTSPVAIGKRINADDEQIKFGGGYDHNFVLNKKGKEMSLAAEVFEPTTGRAMKVYTSEPGIQFYSGNFLDGSNVGKGGKVYKHRYAFCLETQHYPDSPNKQGNKDFPSVILRPGDKYEHHTVYKFTTK